MTRADIAGLVIGAAWVALAAVAPLGLFSIDELIYAAGIHAMATDGSLVVENHVAALGPSGALTLGFLVPGTDGLSPQYPSGFFLLAAPAYDAFGLRGVMLLNALFAAAVLILSGRLAERLFPRPGIGLVTVLLLGLASFMVDYAVAIWPHAPSAFAVLAATLAALMASNPDPGSARRGAFLAGLAVGAGLLLRVDVILIAPALGAWLLLVAPQPLRLVVPGLTGLAPGIAAASALNWLKFETLLPISYGRSIGGTDPLAHGALFLAAGLGLGICAGLRADRVRATLGRPLTLLMGAAAIAGAAALVPELRALVARFGGGAYALMVDARQVSDPRAGVMPEPNGAVSFWGLYKTALGQSLPWLGVLSLGLALSLGSGVGRAGRGLGLVFLVVVIWSLPFIRADWHGGLGSNMRYFLPVMPHLTGAAAWCLLELVERAALERRQIMRLAALGAAGCLLAMVGALRFGGSGGIAPLPQLYSHYLLGALGLAALVAALGAWAKGAFSTAVATGSARAGVALGGAALLAAFVSGPVLDLASNLLRRGALPVDQAAVTDPAGKPSLIYTQLGERHLAQLLAPDGALAIPHIVHGEIDPELAHRALTKRYAVYVDGQALTALLLAADPRLRLVPGPEGEPMREVALRSTPEE